VGNLRLGALGCAIVLALGVAACGNDSVPLSGSIQIDGARSVAPLTEAIAKRFMAEHPDVRISVGASGVDAGFAQFCRGETDAGDAYERIGAKAAADCKRSGVEWGEIAVANDAVILMVNHQTPIRCLTTRQLAQIWHDQSEVTNYWTQIRDLQPRYDEGFQAYGPGTETETYAYFTKVVNGTEGETRDYVNVLEKEFSLPGAVANGPGVLAYGAYGVYRLHRDSVTALQVDSGEGCVAPSHASIVDGTFRPLAHRLLVYPSVEALGRPAMAAFLHYYLDNVEELAPKLGFVALDDEQLRASKAQLEQLIADAGGGASRGS
jgi:phosphate transport system substrate-binding protein